MQDISRWNKGKGINMKTMYFLLNFPLSQKKWLKKNKIQKQLD